MELREAHYDLMTTLIYDMEPFNAVLHMLEGPLSPREAIELLLELQSLGLVDSTVLAETWRRPKPDDFERAIVALEGWTEKSVQTDLWFMLTEAGKAEWRAKNGDRDPRDMWRLFERTDVLEVNAVSLEVAATVVAEYQERHPEIALEQRSTKTPAPFTLADGTRVEPGILVTFGRRRVDARPLS